jgi:hypothetical protein
MFLVREAATRGRTYSETDIKDGRVGPTCAIFSYILEIETLHF